MPHPAARLLLPPAQVWKLGSGSVVLALYQRSFSRDAWPSVQFVADESLAFHLVTNAVNIYSAADWGQCRC